MIERSQLLVFSGFDEKKSWKTLHGNFIGTRGVGLQTMNLGFFPAERNRGREKGEKIKGKRKRAVWVTPTLRLVSPITSQVADSNPSRSDTGREGTT